MRQWDSTRLTRRDLVKTVTVAGGAVVFSGFGPSTWVTAQDKIKLVQWYHQYGEEGTQQAAQRYAEEYTTINPNVEVEMVWKTGDYTFALLPAALLTERGRMSMKAHRPWRWSRPVRSSRWTTSLPRR